VSGDGRLEAALFRVESTHHFHGTTCLCGFDSHGRARSATEHITAEIRAALREDGAR
jgi:hypothetical protein